MRNNRNLAIAAALLLVLTAAGWWIGSPWWTLWRMREAAEAGDSDALAAYIDFPALRASTREQLGSRLGPLGGLVAGPALDAAISPEALRLALGKGRGSRSGDGTGDGGGGGDSGGDSGGEIEFSRIGASEFRVKRGAGDLVFRRQGLSWKLEAVTIALPGDQPRRSTP